MNQFRRLGLNKQIIALILIMLIVLLISFVISNRIAGRIIEKKVTESVSKVFLQVQEKTASFYSDMEGISNSLLYSPTVQTFMSLQDPLEKILMDNEIISVFNNTVTLKDNIRGIQLFDREGKMVESIGIGTGRSVQLPVESTVYSGLLRDPEAKTATTNYTITVPIYNLKSSIFKDYRGTAVFVMDVRNFGKILEGGKITKNSTLMLLDQQNHIIVNEGTALNIDASRLEDWKKDTHYIVQTATLPRTGWKLVSIIPKSELLQDLDTVKRLNIATYVIMFGMLILFLFIFSTRILKPVKEIMDFMRSYPKMERDRRFNVVYHNEIGVLGANLNRMLDEIDSLGIEIQQTQKQKYEIEIAKKQMEISAFRNQINPHFLYNTLECIRAMAFYYKVEDIAAISESLSKMFRYSVKGNDFVTIRDEIAHVGEYAKIVGFRFMGRIKIEMKGEEEWMELKTLKMLLQPIVENAVFHGLEKKIDNGLVRITVRKDERDQIQYIIQDNGYGMEEERYNSLVHRLRQWDSSEGSANEGDQGIGLFNIFRRLKLVYGDAASMTIQSVLHEGTTVIVSFPMHHHSQNKEDETA
ncbi:sensor histidine kinase [Cohnella sp. CFH 77786]|uniref:cache domain-containing sensor histidine kinase n=1 Tax=Cohnella sp. CFH 77786 TaxID=2662265 RepID=UPI001C60EC75|nr:sensor histidine kinase [Cohnella sp. CFH 77786]